MMEIRRTRRPPLTPELTPLIDVVFQLLVFFLLTTTFTLPAVPLDLPKAETSHERRAEQSLVLSITKEGRLFIGETPLPKEKVEFVIRERLGARPHEQVLVRGDIESRYGLFMKVLDACRKAGAQKVLLEANQDAP
jgi:biopolymer transport protein ExbD